MPQFGEGNVEHLVDSFRDTDTLSETSFPKFDDQKEMRKTGLGVGGKPRFELRRLSYVQVQAVGHDAGGRSDRDG